MRSAARHGARDVRVGTWELEAGLREGVGVQAPAIDLDPQQLLQAHVAEAHLRSEVIEQRELAGLGGGLERHGLQAEGVDKPIGEMAAQPTAAVEQPHPLGAFPGLSTSWRAPASSQARPASIN